MQQRFQSQSLPVSFYALTPEKRKIPNFLFTFGTAQIDPEGN